MTNLHKMIIISIYQNIIQNNYKELFGYIKNVSNNYNLCINEVAVTSNFDGIITTKYGIDIELTDRTVSINSELYDFMGKIINASKHNDKLKVSLGYGLRTIDLYHMRASITGGSHCPQKNLISFDIPSYKILGLDAMIYKFAHEMLHEFGYEEEKTLNMEYKYYTKIKDSVYSLIHSLFFQLSDAEKDLYNRIDNIFLSNNKIFGLLNETYTYLLDGFIPNFEDSTISVIHPISKKNLYLNFL